jgi:hypothetical protein
MRVALYWPTGPRLAASAVAHLSSSRTVPWPLVLRLLASNASDTVVWLTLSRVRDTVVPVILLSDSPQAGRGKWWCRWYCCLTRPKQGEGHGSTGDTVFWLTLSRVRDTRVLVMLVPTLLPIITGKASARLQGSRRKLNVHHFAKFFNVLLTTVKRQSYLIRLFKE